MATNTYTNNRVFTDKGTVWLTQIVQPVSIGFDEEGNEMTFPVLINLYYNSDVGLASIGTKEMWEATGVEVKVRYFDYDGKRIGRASSDGIALVKNSKDCLEYLHDSVVSFNRPPEVVVETQEVRSIPVAIWIFMLMETALLLYLLYTSMRGF